MARYPKLFKVHEGPIGELDAMAQAVEQGGLEAAPLAKLVEIMRAHPIKVRKRDGALILDWPSQWENEEVAKVIEQAAVLLRDNQAAAEAMWLGLAKPWKKNGSS